MRIAIISVGSRGDVQPYVALGAGLKAAGHETWLATYPHFERFVTRHGVGFRPVTNAFHELSKTGAWAAWQRSGNLPLRFTFLLGRLLRQGRACFVRLFDDAWRASRDADAIIYPTAGLGGPDIAEKLGVPGYWAHLYPAGRTAEFPCFAGPTWLRLGETCNRLSYVVASQVYRRIIGSALEEWRRSSLGLPPRRRAGGFDPFGPCADPVLYGFSPVVVPKPRDWAETRHITGYWFLPGPEEWQPSDALAAFLAAGPPPIFVSASSLAGNDRLLRQVAVEGPRRARCRLIVQARSHAAPASTPADVFVTGDEVPHRWLFPRVRAVVHHGGAGTVAAALAAGVPSLGIPAFFDQPFWSRRLFELGVSPPPIPSRRLTLDRLLAALSCLAGDTSMKARAARLGTSLRAEAGVSAAVEILCRDLASGRSRRT
jgi:UDP:flavonoid glycosyltransferase YjiC (YdhE family)